MWKLHWHFTLVFPLPSHLPFIIEPQWKSLIVLVCLYVVSFLSEFCPFVLPVSLTATVLALLCFSISSPCGTVDYNVTFIFWGFPCPCQETGPIFSVFLVIIPPCQTKQEKLWGLNLSVSLYRLWIWIRESLDLRGLRAQAICFPLVVI